MAVIDTPDDVTLTAPGPNGTKSGNAQVVGRPGARTYYYWVIVNYPIGSSVSRPFLVRNAPNTLTVSNYVTISWEPAPKAVSYDLLRTDTGDFPQQSGNYAVAAGITGTFLRDQGGALQPYNLAGLQFGAPVRCRIYLNNRDYSKPTLEMPCQLSVTTLIFPDGSTQSSAGGGGGSQGPPGPQGPAGPQGATGATGQQGPAGATGATGPQGPAGAAGATGAVGPQGTPGAAGATGPQGPAGATGAQGSTGATGPAGPQGPAGTGVVIKGSVPTESDLPMTGNQPGDAWITEDTGHMWVWGGLSWTDAGNITGPEGQQGPEGPIGPTGPQGATGATGAAGPQGATGPPGPIIPASATVLGGVKIGANITVQVDGTISVPASSFFQTPWLSNIDGAAFILNNVGEVNIGLQGSNPAPLSVAKNMESALVQLYNPSTTTGPWIHFVNDDGQGLDVKLGASNEFLSEQSNNGLIGASGDLLLAAGGSEQMRITAAGNVGIGTITPAYALDVVGDVNVTGTYRINGVPLSFGGNQTPWLQDINAAGFRLLSTGKVGIANANPQNFLDIGPAQAGGVTGHALQVSFASGNNGIYIVNGSNSPSDLATLAFIQAGATRGAVFTVNNALRAEAYSGNPVVLQLNGGNVGIGTTGPRSQLALIPATNPVTPAVAQQITIGEQTNSSGFQLALGYYGNINTGQYGSVIQSLSGGVGDTLLINPSGGNVGIGTTTDPQVPLHVAGPVTGDPAWSIFVDPDNSLASAGMALGRSSGVAAIATFGGGPLALQASNVGIGTTTPTSKLEVQGTQVGISVMNNAGSQNYYFGINDFDSNKLYIGAGRDPSQDIPPVIVVTPGTGNVGIGMTSPAATLHVVGTLAVGSNLPLSTMSTGDISVSRDAAPQTGVVYFGNTGAYIFFDGTNFQFSPPSTNLGVQGPAGPQGSPGATGATGPQGPQGSPGATGATGATGPQGPQGPQGSPATSLAAPAVIQSSDVNTTCLTISLNTSPGIALQINSGGNAIVSNSDNVLKPTPGPWSGLSDGRLKRNVRDFKDGLDKLIALRIIEHEFNGLGGIKEGTHGIGVIAQEAQEVVPYCILPAPTGPPDSEERYLAFDSGPLTWIMVNAFREIHERLQKLEA